MLFLRKLAIATQMPLPKYRLQDYIRIKGTLIDDVRFAFGAVGPTMVRSVDIEKKLLGKTVPLDSYRHCSGCSCFRQDH